MRKFLALLLLSTVATPALADPGDTIRRAADREAREQARSERQESRREARSNDNSGEPQQQQQPQSGNHNERGNRGGNGPPQIQVDNGGGANHPSFRGRRQVQPDTSGGEQPAIVNNGGGDDGATNIRRNRRLEDRVRVVRPQIVEQGDVSRQPGQPGLRQLERPLPRVMQGRTPVISRTPREGTQPPLRVENHRRDRHRWDSGSWRSDHRYNWREHRRRHRSLFHLGIYFDPFGWNYRPYSIGWRLWPGYYSSRYWIHDPWQYRLPYAPPGYRWIRYHDDALLVDTWDGRVVDVIYNFFW
jgi:hypothetical protein